MGKIILKIHNSREKFSEIIRITPKAAEMLNSLCAETGLSVRTIASELIVQGANMVEVVRE